MNNESGADFEILIKQLAQIKAKKEELKTQYEAEKAVLDKQETELECEIMASLNKQGILTVKTQFGSVEKKIKTAVTIANSEEFFNFVIENKAIDLLHKRINQAAFEERVLEYIEKLRINKEEELLQFKNKHISAALKLGTAQSIAETAAEKAAEYYLQSIALEQAVAGVKFESIYKLIFKKSK